jgi:hypothetical protein
MYVVRGDPRLCPSPICGGYWVSLANRARTRCHDGLLRPRCYVAEAHGAVAEGGLARAMLGSKTYPGIGELGVLVVAESWAPVGTTRPTGDYFRVRDRGIRCIKAPCPSYAVAQLNRSLTTTVSRLDLTYAGLTPAELKAASRELAGRGVLLLGRIARPRDAGAILQATRAYLRAPQPRA